MFKYILSVVTLSFTPLSVIADDMSKLVEGLSSEFSGESKYSNSEFRQFELCQAINGHKECLPIAFHCKSNICKISTL
ncbi:MAG: hypothetical protein ACJAS1_004235 [Oleiphilaceae bacterium]|jgi:hypothetical protein